MHLAQGFQKKSPAKSDNLFSELSNGRLIAKTTMETGGVMFRFPLICGELIFERMEDDIIQILADGKKYLVTSEEFEKGIKNLGFKLKEK